MTKPQELFNLTRWLLKTAAAVSIIVISVLCLALGALVLALTGLVHIPLPASVLANGISVSKVLAIGALAVAAALVCVALVAWVFVMAGRIVESARSGDPFVIGNAKRLEQIGWLLLATQIIGLLANMSLSAMLPEKVGGKIDVGIGFDISPIGLLSILLIFVLAQIFRHGSEMRDELEGTV